MKREVELKDISDGRLYSAGDMVRADCGGCKDCHACCRGMGRSVILDPYDICRLKEGLSRTFEDLLKDKLELNVVDGIILPNLKMSDGLEQCAFLGEDKRCTIHLLRPGICRLFPLGRYYDNHSFRYFLQTNECLNGNRIKVKVRKWVDQPDLNRYEKFITDWHYFLNEMEQAVRSHKEAEVRQLNLYLLNRFFNNFTDREESFYENFYTALNEAETFAAELTGGTNL